MTVTPITLADLTGATLEGVGIFDVLMRVSKLHLDSEFRAGRIKGPEYATVYLGTLDSILTASMTFLLQKQKASLEAALLEQQGINLVAEATNLGKQGLLVDAQKAQVTQQSLNLVSEKLSTEAKTLQITQQNINLVAEATNLGKQGLLVDAQKAQITQQSVNLVSEQLNISKQGLLIDAQKDRFAQEKTNLISDNLGIQAKTTLTTQQKLNAVTEETVLVSTKCKLDAEYDLLVITKDKTTQEGLLLAQKIATEKAQVTALGVDANSVVGAQKALYAAQTTGFLRDAEQKAAKVMVDSWNVRRTTDEGTIADGTNMLNDTAVGRAVTKLLNGVSA